ncbi:MAG: hypothetical protein ACNA8W_20725 [Bradymonadaceae bacterium]
MRPTLLVIALAITTLVAACATGPSSSDSSTKGTRGALETVAFTAEQRDDANIAVRLENGSSRSLGANLCTAKLQVKQGDEWQPVESELTKKCVDEHVVINPGANREATFSGEGLPAGDYRFAMKVEIPMGLGFEDVATDSFTLSDAPATAAVGVEVEEEVEESEEVIEETEDSE